jgi:hypothetical protein
MPKTREGGIYCKRGRAYGDFRDLGDGEMALRAPGEAVRFWRSLPSTLPHFTIDEAPSPYLTMGLSLTSERATGLEPATLSLGS